MQHTVFSSILAFVTVSLLTSVVSAAELTVTLDGKASGSVIADRHAFCPPAGAQGDISPAVTWSVGPKGTRSYALRMQDLDVPAAFDQIEKPGVIIEADAPRISVDHWLLADIPAGANSFAEGVDSSAFIKGGKPTGSTDHGVRGTNIYASFFASNTDMAGPYGGYDGPCPPMNDKKPHRYAVHVFALDVASLKLVNGFTGETLASAMAGHILAQGQVTGTYSRLAAGK